MPKPLANETDSNRYYPILRLGYAHEVQAPSPTFIEVEINPSRTALYDPGPDRARHTRFLADNGAPDGPQLEFLLSPFALPVLEKPPSIPAVTSQDGMQMLGGCPYEIAVRDDGDNPRRAEASNY